MAGPKSYPSFSPSIALTTSNTPARCRSRIYAAKETILRASQIAVWKEVDEETTETHCRIQSIQHIGVPNVPTDKVVWVTKDRTPARSYRKDTGTSGGELGEKRVQGLGERSVSAAAEGRRLHAVVRRRILLTELTGRGRARRM